MSANPSTLWRFRLITLLLHSHSLLTPFLSFSSLYFTLYLPLYSTFNTPGYFGLLGLLGLLTCQPPGVYHYLPYSSHLYPSSLTLLAGGWLHFSLLALLIILHLSFHLLWGSHYFPYSSSCISIYLIFILPQIYSLISFPLPTYSLTLLNFPLYIPNYSLTSFPQPTFIYSPLLALPLLISWLSFSACPIQHYFTSLTCVPFIQNITYPYIHNTTKSLITTQNITPFSLSFPFYYSLFPIFNSNIILYCFISYSTKLYSPLLPFSLFTILNYYTLLPYYHFHYYPPFLYLILYYYSYIFTFNLPMRCDKIHYLIQFKYSFSFTSCHPTKLLFKSI